MSARRRWALWSAGALVVVVLFASRVAGFYIDVLWFDSIGFGRVYWSLLATRFGLGTAAGLLVGLLVAANLWFARRAAPRYRLPSPGEAFAERYREAVAPYTRPLVIGVSLLLGLLSGLSMAGRWPTALLWANAQEFGRTDPQFGRDLGYFVFVLPFYDALASWLFGSLILVLLLTVAAHYIFGGIRPQAPAQRISPQANVHLSVLLAMLVAVRAWGLYLDQFMLSYSSNGTVTGLSYTDVTARLPAYRLLLFIALFCVVLFLVNIRSRGWLLPAAGVGILAVAAVVLLGIFPAVVQRLQVAPQELQREEPYIARNLEATRFGFDIAEVAVEPYPVDPELSAEEVEASAETLASMRLWDTPVALTAYRQLQTLRPYYDFRGVDVDRYELEDGTRRQLLVSAREMTGLGLPVNNWANRHLTYTHGIGLVASQASTASPDGQPNFVSNNIPPTGDEALLVDNPRVYFGESGLDYAVVRTRQAEIDFARETGPPERTTYDGADGVAAGSLGRRAAFALRFAEPNLVLSNLLTDESKVLLRRDIVDRVQSVAPFLQLDHDPYPVAADGRVKWVIDAYTASNMVPYAQRQDLAALTRVEQLVFGVQANASGEPEIVEQTVRLPALRGEANYLRNSVKAVVDAYDGTVELYVAEPEDPIIRAWRQAFPEAFTDMAAASEELQAHFRYPEDLFRVQSAVYERYHIAEPEAFYTQEDAWVVPQDPAYIENQRSLPVERQSQPRPVPPLYQLLRLPGESDLEFVLTRPYTPGGQSPRPNLIAYLIARSDPEGYGELRAYRMPPNQTVFGPQQVQSRINQDDEIAQELTLLNQRGSAVIYGNLLTLPIEGSLLYAQGLFLRAETSEIPELRKVIVAFGEDIVMRDTLADALQDIFGVVPEGVGTPQTTDAPPVDAPPGEEPEDPGDGEAPPADASPQVQTLIQQALEAFAAAEEALRTGDLGTYQERTDEAEQLLQQAEALLGGAVAPPPEGASEPPTAAPTAAPTEASTP